MAKRKAGRPKKDSDFLAMEVHRVMQAFDVGADEACRRIAISWRAPIRLHYLADGKHKSKQTKKGIKPAALSRRYWRWRDAEQKRQDKNKATDKIIELLTS